MIVTDKMVEAAMRKLFGKKLYETMNPHNRNLHSAQIRELVETAIAASDEVTASVD